MEKLKKCPICNNEQFSDYLKCYDYFLTQEEFNIVTCNNCRFTFVNPRPEADNLSKYYNSTEYVSHSATKNKGLFNYVYRKIRNYTHKKKVNLVSYYSKGKSILDIGCASGEFLNLFKLKGWKTKGIEPNSNARNFAKKEYNLDVIDENDINDVSNESIDVITMWHVLEHVSDLNQRMLDLKRILKKDGYLIIAVPNCTSYDAEYYRNFWAAYDVPRHLYHFTPETMQTLVEKYKFSIVNKLPMKFDSYYVSMLSEKYKSGKLNILKAIYIGLKSNLKAHKSLNNYSSLIYVIKIIEKN
ncbi:MAG: class I SAM-dependent methyltransferase [Bacteroidetes bacterium]|nr:class I SAM-dependent methyltransferase [Bacteroidota bacterium]